MKFKMTNSFYVPSSNPSDLNPANANRIAFEIASDSQPNEPGLLPGTGFSLLLVVFFSVCILLTASLSMASAKNNFRLTSQSADHLTAYTSACNASEEILAQLTELTSGNGNSPMHVQTSQGEITVNISETDSYSGFSWTVPVSDSQGLFVSVACDKNSENEYRILSWKVTSVSGQNPAS